MARNDNVQDFVRDVADAIRTKTGSSDLINPQYIPEIIEGLQTGNANVNVINNNDGTQGIYINGDVMYDNSSSINKVEINGEDVPLYQESGGESGEDRFKLFMQNELTEVKAEDFGSLTTVAPYSFYDKSNLEFVELSNDITGIGNYAFYNTGIKNINLPENIYMINTYAFANCKQLENITMPNSLGNMSSNVFNGCTSLKSITIPENVTTLGSYLLQNCTNLIEINYNATNLSNLTAYSYLTQGAGTNASGITVNIGANVTKIPDYLFNPYNSGTYTNNITSVNFEAGSLCTSIGQYAFSYCQNLISINIPDSITSIGQYAFNYCQKLKNVTIPSGINAISNYMFNYCRALTNITIPSNILTIGTNAFYTCDKLTTITIPSTITSIGNFAFGYCTALTSANIYTTASTNKINSSSYRWFGNCSTSLVIHAPSSLNATTSKTAYGNYWNYRTTSATHTTYYDL